MSIPFVYLRTLFPTSMKKTTIIMVDDDPIVRNAVCTFVNLQENLEVVAEKASAEDFLNSTFEEMPSILLLDVGLPGITGLEALPFIKDKYPSLDIIMLTTYEEEDLILRALCNGACSYISKRAGLKSIVEGIQIVANGGSYMSPRIAREIVNHFVKHKQAPSVTLEGRQKEIMEFLLEGESYSDIGSKLNISVETVRSHIKKIYKTLHVNNKAEAIASYLKNQN